MLRDKPQSTMVLTVPNEEVPEIKEWVRATILEEDISDVIKETLFKLYQGLHDSWSKRNQ